MRYSTNAATTPSRVALAAGLLFLGCFQMETWEVRFGNIDDVDYFTVFRSGTLLSYIEATARSEGRFFQFWYQGFIELLNHIRSHFWFGLHRTVLVGGEFALGAWLLARLSGDNRLGWLFWVLGLGTLQIPPGFYPLLSYPPIGFGFIALLTAALAYDHALVDDQPRLSYAAAACFVASLLLHDIFVTFAPLFPLILLARHPRRFRENLSTLTPLAVGFAAYLVIYFGYRWLRAAEHTYEGTAFSFDLVAWAMTWLRYTLSVAPGFELWFLRDLSPPAPLLREWTSAAEFVGRELSFSGVAKAALLVVSVGWLIREPLPPTARRRVVALLAGACVLAALACVPIALTPKYHFWARHRQMPYVYSFFTVYFGWVAAGAGLLALRGEAIQRPLLNWKLGTALIAIFYAALCAQITNPAVLRHLHEKYNREKTEVRETP